MLLATLNMDNNFKQKKFFELEIGYINPTVLLDISANKIILRKSGLTTLEIADEFENLMSRYNAVIITRNIEPNTTEFLKKQGWNVVTY